MKTYAVWRFNTAFKKDSGVELGTSNGGQRLATRTPEWKCLWRIVYDKVEIYNLDADPGETDDVSEAHPDVVGRLQNEMEEYREAARETDTDLPDVEESDEVKQRLQDPGYAE